MNGNEMEEKIEVLARQIEKIYRIDFYRQKFDQAGIRPFDIRSMDDFRKIPFTKSSEILEELRKRPSECSLYSGDVTRINFSPSGQELYPVYQTDNDLRRMHEVCERSLRTAGVIREDICVVTYGYHLFIAAFYQASSAARCRVSPARASQKERSA
jgi:phenylacetate-CoA ligase